MLVTLLVEVKQQLVVYVPGWVTVLNWNLGCPFMDLYGVVLAMDGEVLAPDGEVLDTGWCSTGSRMVEYWPPDGSIPVRKCCRKSWELFWKKRKQTAGCIDKTVAC
jgi:hypothetical protein